MRSNQLNENSTKKLWVDWVVHNNNALRSMRTVRRSRIDWRQMLNVLRVWSAVGGGFVAVLSFVRCAGCVVLRKGTDCRSFSGESRQCPTSKNPLLGRAVDDGLMLLFEFGVGNAIPIWMQLECSQGNYFVWNVFLFFFWLFLKQKMNGINLNGNRMSAALLAGCDTWT